MQFQRSSPVTLLVLTLLFAIFTHAAPLSLRPRDDLTCAPEYVSCTTYCCPPSHSCTSDGGCAPIPVTEASTTAATTTSQAPSASSTANASSGSSATSKPKKDEPLLNTKIIIVISVGGGIALLLLIVGCCACHRKRQQGRALLAAYESPDREPYEAISLKTKKSTASFNSSAPPAPIVPGTPKSGTPTAATFNIPQHASTPPPQYRGGTSQAIDEKDLFPRYPPQAFQGQDSATSRPPSSPILAQNRAVFPVEVLGSQRSSSLPPYSPQRTAFAHQQGPGSPQQATFSPQQTAFSPTQSSFPRQQTAFSPTQSAFHPQQTAFSPTQETFSPQQASFPQQPSFTFNQQGAPSPMHSPPISPMTPSNPNHEMFFPLDGHHPQPSPQPEPQHGPQHGYPMAY